MVCGWHSMQQCANEGVIVAGRMQQHTHNEASEGGNDFKLNFGLNMKLTFNQKNQPCRHF
jgi:hypothetical protein